MVTHTPALERSEGMTARTPLQTLGDKACRPERSEGSGLPDAEILRCAQDDSAVLRMTGLDLAVGEELSSSFEPCLTDQKADKSAVGTINRPLRRVVPAIMDVSPRTA